MDYLSQVPLTGSWFTTTLVKDAGATTISSTLAWHFHIKGKSYLHAAATNLATPTTDVNTGVAFVRVGTNEGCVYVLGWNASGTLQVAQSACVPLDASGLFVNAAVWPSIPDTMCPIGYMVTKCGSTAAAKATGFLFGTTNFTAVTGQTNTMVEIGILPDRPQVS